MIRQTREDRGGSGGSGGGGVDQLSGGGGGSGGNTVINGQQQHHQQQRQHQVVDIHSLFDHNRIDKNMDLLLLIVYFPLGLCLFLVRLFIGLHAILVATILPKKSSIRCFILRSMCSILGIIVREENASIDVKSKTRIVISNHITNIDHLAVDLCMPCLVPGIWDLPKLLNWALGFHDLGAKQGRDVLINNVRMYLNNTTTTDDNNSNSNNTNHKELPILCYPEGATTNGRVGLLKYSTWIFSIDTKIQPIFVTVSRPAPINVAVSVLGSRWWSDLFWFLFVPFSVFTIKYLPSVERNYGESADEFAGRVQVLMANDMRIRATNYTDADKVELAKKLFQKPKINPNYRQINPRIRPSLSMSSTSSSSSSSSPSMLSTTNTTTNTTTNILNTLPPMMTRSRGSTTQIDLMAHKVKEVLPQVPISVIQKDIKVTTNIDETITRLLDGTVIYVPEVVVVNTSSSDGQSSSSSSAATTTTTTNRLNNSYISTESDKPFYCGAKTFGRTANERSKSYKDRKQQLLEAARLRYLEKQGQQQQ